MTRQEYTAKLEYLEEEVEAAFEVRDKYEALIEDCLSEHKPISEETYNKYNLMCSEVVRVEQEIKRLVKKHGKTD